MSNGSRRLSWHWEYRQLHRSAGDSNLDQTCWLFLANEAVQAHRIHIGVRHGHVIVPRDLRQRIWCFLEHGVGRMLAGTHGCFLV